MEHTDQVKRRRRHTRSVCVCLSLGTVHLITYPVPAHTHTHTRYTHVCFTSSGAFTWVCSVPYRISSAKKITVCPARDSESETKRFRNLRGRSWLVNAHGNILMENALVDVSTMLTRRVENL